MTKWDIYDGSLFNTPISVAITATFNKGCMLIKQTRFARHVRDCGASFRMKPLGLSLLISGLLSLGVLSSAANADPCYTIVVGRMMQLSNGSIESCIRTIIAARAGHGLWGGHKITIGDGGVAYIDGQKYGRARSSQEEGTASPYNRWGGQEQRNWNYYRYNQPK